MSLSEIGRQKIELIFSHVVCLNEADKGDVSLRFLLPRHIDIILSQVFICEKGDVSLRVAVGKKRAEFYRRCVVCVFSL